MTDSIKPSLLFSHLVGSLYFGKIRFSRLFRGRNSCRCLSVEFEKILHVHRYSVDMLSFSDPLGILGYAGEQNTAIRWC